LRRRAELAPLLLQRAAWHSTRRHANGHCAGGHGARHKPAGSRDRVAPRCGNVHTAPVVCGNKRNTEKGQQQFRLVPPAAAARFSPSGSTRSFRSSAHSVVIPIFFPSNPDIVF